MHRLALILLATAALYAQGSITGVVRDQFGTALDRIPVELQNAPSPNTPNKPKLTATTGADGSYTFANLAPGDYEVLVNLPSMSGYKSPALKVAASPVRHEAKVSYNTQLGTLGEDFRAGLDEQARHRNITGPTPKSFDGHPDFSGVWFRPVTVDPGKPQYTEAAEAALAARNKANRADSNQSRCLPSAATRYGPLFQLVQSKDYLVIINDDDSPGFYQIYLDGRKPASSPQWYGNNIGRWEGDTLIVDRTGFDDRMWIDQAGHSQSGKLHVIDRYRRTDLGHLEITTTIEDPGVLKAPYTVKQTADLAQGEMIYEFVCTENERDVKHFTGN
jgi:hypothetical protein